MWKCQSAYRFHYQTEMIVSKLLREHSIKKYIRSTCLNIFETIPRCSIKGTSMEYLTVWRIDFQNSHFSGPKKIGDWRSRDSIIFQFTRKFLRSFIASEKNVRKEGKKHFRVISFLAHGFLAGSNPTL